MMLHEEVEATYEYLEGLYRRPIIPPEVAGLDRIRFLLERLDNPHRRFPAIHVTGTCGKGSTTTMIANILHAASYRVGVFRSPHMDSYRERIADGSEIIDEADWLTAFHAVRPLGDRMERGEETGYDGGRISLFEFVWAMAVLHFARQRMDIAVVEVGIGGRLSPTNVLDPLVAVLTNVSLDHTGFLGPTERHIAREKAAIIKPGSAAITAAVQPEVLGIVEDRCAETNSPLWRVGKETTIEVKGSDLKGETIDVRTPVRAHRDLHVPLLGRHQATNAATAVSAVDSLLDRGFSVPAESVQDGLASVTFPGRFEILSQNPTVILDGARNGASASTLRHTLDDLFPNRRVVAVIGVLADKDAEAIVTAVGPRVSAAIITNPPWEERLPLSPDGLTKSLEEHTPDITVIPDIAAALTEARDRARDDDIILITGSLYLVATARQMLLNDGLAVAAPSQLVGSSDPA